jgi:hypothetical protein
MEALWMGPDIAEERDRNGAGCPACGRPTCTVGVYPCCRNSRRVTGDGQHVPDWELGHYVDLFAHGYGTTRLPWQEALAQFGRRALIAMHYLAVRWWPTTLSVDSAADNVEHACQRFWVTSCVHDGPPGKPCAWCQALLDELERRGYSVWTLARRLSGVGGLRAGEEIVLCVDATHAARIAGEQMVVHGGIPVWRMFDITRWRGEPRYALKGMFVSWDSATMEARCRAASGALFLDKPGYKVPDDEARELAVAHLRGGRCSCGIYGVYRLNTGLMSAMAGLCVEPMTPGRGDRKEIGLHVSVSIALARALAHGVVNVGINGVRASDMTLLRIYLPVVLPPESPWVLPVAITMPGFRGTRSRVADADSRARLLAAAERLRARIERRYRVPVTIVPVPLDALLSEGRVIAAFGDQDAGNIGVWLGVTDEAMLGLIDHVTPYEDDPWDRDPARERLLARRWGHVVELSS